MISDNMASVNFMAVPANTYNVPTGSGSGGWNFSDIRRLNIFINNYQKVNASDAVKNLYLGEVYFF